MGISNKIRTLLFLRPLSLHLPEPLCLDRTISNQILLQAPFISPERPSSHDLRGLAKFVLDDISFPVFLGIRVVELAEVDFLGGGVELAGTWGDVAPVCVRGRRRAFLLGLLARCTGERGAVRVTRGWGWGWEGPVRASCRLCRLASLALFLFGCSGRCGVGLDVLVEMASRANWW